MPLLPSEATCSFPKSCGSRRKRIIKLLPTGLGDSGDESVRRQFAEGDTRELESAQERAAATGDEAAVDKPDRARIARKLTEALIIFLCFELGTEFRPLRHGGAFAFVTFKP